MNEAVRPSFGRQLAGEKLESAKRPAKLERTHADREKCLELRRHFTRFGLRGVEFHNCKSENREGDVGRY
jgi:hypothetical protein